MPSKFRTPWSTPPPSRRNSMDLSHTTGENSMGATFNDTGPPKTTIGRRRR